MVGYCLNCTDKDTVGTAQQNKLHGKGRRVHTPLKSPDGAYRCTLCLATNFFGKDADKKSK